MRETYYSLYYCVPGSLLVVVRGSDRVNIFENSIGKDIGSIYNTRFCIAVFWNRVGYLTPCYLVLRPIWKARFGVTFPTSTTRRSQSGGTGGSSEASCTWSTAVVRKWIKCDIRSRVGSAGGLDLLSCMFIQGQGADGAACRWGILFSFWNCLGKNWRPLAGFCIGMPSSGCSVRDRRGIRGSNK